MISSQFRRPTFWLMAGLLAFAAFVRFRGIRFGLPHTQARPDETAIIDPVRVLLSGHLPHFYDYPWLFLWMVAIAYVGYFLWGAATGAFSIDERHARQLARALGTVFSHPASDLRGRGHGERAHRLQTGSAGARRRHRRSCRRFSSRSCSCTSRAPTSERRTS